MNEEEVQPRDHWLSRAFTVFLRTLVALFVLSFLFAFRAGPAVMEMMGRMAVGWMFHGSHVIPPTLSRWDQCLVPLGAVLLATWCLHRLISWMHVAKGLPDTWPFKRTVSVVSLLLLGSAAAIAMSGVLHQGVWLMSEQLIVSNHRSDLTYAISNARQIQLALFEYEADHGHYPDSLQDLEETYVDSENLRRLIWLKRYASGPDEPFVLLKPGAEIHDPNEPVLMSPAVSSPPEFAVGYADASAIRVKLSSLQSGKPPPRKD